MYQVSSEFSAANAKRSQKHKVRGSIGSTSFDDSNILAGSFSIVKQNSDGVDIKVGACYISTLRATFLRNIGILPRGWIGKTITVEFGLCVDEIADTYEWVPLGKYTISDASIDNSGTTITAYDYLAFLDKLLPDKFSLSGSLHQILTRVTSACNIPFRMTDQDCEALPNGDEPLGLYIPNDCQTYRDVVFWLSQVVGGWAETDREGYFVLRSYPAVATPASTMHDADLVNGAKFSSYLTSFGSVIFSNEDDTTSFYGSEGIGLTYQCGLNPFLIYGTLSTRTNMRTRVLNVLSSIRYQPFEVSLMSAPIYDLGDVIYFDGDIAGSESYDGIINRIEFKAGGGFKLAGFGANPNLQSTKDQSERTIAAARSSASDKETEYSKYINQNQISIGSTPVKVTEINFSANKPTTVEMWSEYMIETSPNTGESLELTATYYLDLIELDRRPVETFDDAAKHLLDLHYMEKVQDAGSHQWQIYLEASGGTATIRPKGGLSILKGQGLAKESAWNGVIVLDDTVPAFSILSFLASLNDSVSVGIEPLTYHESFSESIDVMNVGSELNAATDSATIDIHLVESFPYCGEEYYSGMEDILL